MSSTASSECWRWRWRRRDFTGPRSGPGRQALSLLTISDHLLTKEALSPMERQESFSEMMEVALETAWETLEDE